MLERMEQYKRDWAEKHGEESQFKEWRWQDKDTEDYYKEFMKAQAEQDPKIDKDADSGWEPKQDQKGADISKKTDHYLRLN